MRQVRARERRASGEVAGHTFLTASNEAERLVGHYAAIEDALFTHAPPPEAKGSAGSRVETPTSRESVRGDGEAGGTPRESHPVS